MKPITQINVISIKPGKTDEFFEAQRSYIASIAPPSGLIGIRMYKSMDGNFAVLVTQFESAKALEDARQRAVLREHIAKVQPLVESSTQTLYEELYAVGDIRS
jgi:heme-degrading monooxygenase HmoA